MQSSVAESETSVAQQHSQKIGENSKLTEDDSCVGYIYVLVNQSFPEWVKIGYADDIHVRLKQLNRSECVPFPFQVYALYEVETRLADLDLHAIIDKLNPSLRAVGEVDGKRRVREFYAMSPEDAYDILMAIAKMHGRRNKLKKYKVDDTCVSFDSAIRLEEQDQTRKGKSDRAKMFTFSLVGIPKGAVLEYCGPSVGSSVVCCKVVDDRRVEFDGEVFSLSALAVKLSESKTPMQGPKYFMYNGEVLTDLRNRLGV